MPLLRRVGTFRASLRSVLRTLRPSMRLTHTLAPRRQKPQIWPFMTVLLLCFSKAVDMFTNRSLLQSQIKGALCMGYGTVRFYLDIAPTGLFIKMKNGTDRCVQASGCKFLREPPGGPEGVRSTEPKAKPVRWRPVAKRRGTP